MNAIYKTIQKSFILATIIGMTMTLNAPVAKAADGASPAIAAHYSKLLSSQFLAKNGSYSSTEGNRTTRNSFAATFSKNSSKLVSSQFSKDTTNRLNPTAASMGTFSKKQHTAKPHLSF